MKDLTPAWLDPCVADPCVANHRRSREGGSPVSTVEKSLDPRLRGEDNLNIFSCRISRSFQE